MNKIFFTGFPGFIGNRLVRRIVEQPDKRIIALVYPDPRQIEKARAFASEYNGGGRIEIIPGDIAQPRFGLDPETFDRLRHECSEVYHLAALYNLAAPKDLSYQVNVEGTRHVLGFCEGAKHFRKLVYFSTIVVSGDRTGTIQEDDLEAGQRFRNYYEETKFLAEVEVRRRAKDIPTIVIRPAVVIGDSRSGEIDKYDGPYYFLSALARLEKKGQLGIIGRLLGLGKAPSRFHLVPVDFVVNATTAIANDPESIGKTFHLIDPNELTVSEVRSLIFQRFGITELPVNVPAGVVRGVFSLPGVGSLLKMPKQLFDYMDLSNTYDASNTRAVLEKAGVECPSIPGYVDTMVAYVRSHPEVPVSIL